MKKFFLELHKAINGNSGTIVFAALLFCFTAFAAAPVQAAAGAEFTDLPTDHWAYKNVMALKASGVVVGYPDGSFHPDENVTRSEFAAIIVKALNLQDKGDFYPVTYKDLAQEYWGYNAIQIATHYGLVAGTPDGYYLPNDPVKRVEIMMVIMNTLAIRELTPETAAEHLAVYEDVDQLPAWGLLRSGKAQQLNMVVIMPGHEGKLEPMRPATRSEVVAFVYNMLDRVKVHPNKKIASELPKMADGYVLDNVYFDGTVANIPAGTILPLGIMTHTDSKEAKPGDEFSARTLKHFTDKDSILLIPVGTRFVGKVEKVKKGIPVIRNAEMVFVTQDMLDEEGNPASVFPAVADTKPTIVRTEDFWEKFNYHVFKGRNFILHRSQMKEFILLEPVRIDVMNNWVSQ